MFNWVKRHKISSLALMFAIGVIIGLGIAARFNLPSKSNAASPEEKSVKTVAVTGEIDIQNA
ncbi:MAG: hypothetical protein Q8N91_04865, partial [Candidatus Omnitrophota bacterium]|nr:hypothetical protein [Candidatus Omnitrophota bacterium]